MLKVKSSRNTHTEFKIQFWGLGSVKSLPHKHEDLHKKMGVVAHVCNPGTRKAGIGGSLGRSLIC